MPLGCVMLYVQARRAIAENEAIMGYRSDVALVIKSDDYKELISNHISSETIKEVISWGQFSEKEEAVLVRWEYIKWYGDKISAFNKAIESIDHENWRLVKIGEMQSDIDENGEYYDNPFNLGVSVSLSIDY